MSCAFHNQGNCLCRCKGPIFVFNGYPYGKANGGKGVLAGKQMGEGVLVGKKMLGSLGLTFLAALHPGTNWSCCQMMV